MNFLYDFGISQDDPNVEDHALKLNDSNLLCIASGGEVPLSMLAMYDTQIKALDISINQIRLCNLKLASVRMLEPDEAAVFLGFKKDHQNKRSAYFTKVASVLSSDDVEFWNNHNIKNGPIACSRFEKYISVFCKLVRLVMGNKRTRQYFDLESIEEQEKYFTKYLQKKLILWIFKVAFSPGLYKKRGLDKQALIHQKGNDMASFFYGKFKDFFTATPARNNYYLQFYFLNEIISDQAFPIYLQPEGVANIRNRYKNLNFEIGSVIDEISGSELLSYENYALSNLSDWCDESSMNELVLNISKKSSTPANVLMRYIHKNPGNETLKNLGYDIDINFQDSVLDLDRFPFYSLIRATINYPKNL